MEASVFELILARVEALLRAGPTAAGPNVFRGRDDAFRADELPALNIRRANTAGEVIGNIGERHVSEFEIDHLARGAGWETAADALHMQVHALLLADTTLAGKGRGLRCTGTEPQSDSADQLAGRIKARYQMQVLVRPGDLTQSAT